MAQPGPCASRGAVWRRRRWSTTCWPTFRATWNGPVGGKARPRGRLRWMPRRVQPLSASTSAPDRTARSPGGRTDRSSLRPLAPRCSSSSPTGAPGRARRPSVAGHSNPPLRDRTGGRRLPRGVHAGHLPRLDGAPAMLRAPVLSRLVFWISAKFDAPRLRWLLALAEVEPAVPVKVRLSRRWWPRGRGSPPEARAATRRCPPRAS